MNTLVGLRVMPQPGRVCFRAQTPLRYTSQLASQASPSLSGQVVIECVVLWRGLKRCKIVLRN